MNIAFFYGVKRYIYLLCIPGLQMTAYPPSPEEHSQECCSSLVPLGSCPCSGPLAGAVHSAPRRPASRDLTTPSRCRSPGLGGSSCCYPVTLCPLVLGPWKPFQPDWTLVRGQKQQDILFPFCSQEIQSETWTSQLTPRSFLLFMVF